MITRIIVFAACVMLTTFAFAQSPLPGDLSLVPPVQGVPKSVAAFSGAWKGLWGGTLPSALAVEQVDSNGTAKVVYSWGDEPMMKIKAGWARMTGTISNDTLHLMMDKGPNIDFELKPDGHLSGQYRVATIVAFTDMERIQGTNAAEIIASTQKADVQWREVRIPVHSQLGPTAGKTFMLQTTIYPVDSPGKHPVVLFSHGSTGPGIIPANEVFRGGAEEMLFHSLGYIEVLPMRKGRGDSEGPNVEEDFNLPPSVGLDSAVEDVHTVIDYLGTLPDVDTNRIVLSGVSRGGFLSAIYAGRYPSNIVGVINFSGGWFGEGIPNLSDFNFQEFRKAGRDAKVPMLWLHADHDSYYSLKFVENEFADFKKAGGAGDLVETRDIVGEGHLLVLHVDKWEGVATNYLSKVDKR